ncbi:TcfC E-set like domain-containing protein [Vibrio parahaemolyticus]|uniref:TcfC E-set like domain-containing protein n=1 Tax=Vibrio parahaemolyticus TaxID=670 RepID=UPI0024BC9DD2|nr:TcfC E-set like domain-containing protein [Vibrio parahaemolyticus]WHT05027.1 TcfC E-set like domain-containing protein [Vibrio parahaemolyticus]
MIKKKIIPIVSMVFSSYVMASPIPEEFKSLYNMQEHEVNAIGVNGKDIVISLYSGYDFIQIKDNESIKRYKEFLKDSNIKDIYVEEILSDLKSGRNNNTVCLGLIEECTYVPKTYDLYYDYYSNKLYIYVNPKILTTNDSFDTDTVSYFDSGKDDWSLINTFDFYTSMSSESKNTYSIYNKSLFGLPYGHIIGDFDFRSNDSNLDWNELSYTLEKNEYKYIVGLTEDGSDINTTSFIQPNTFSREIGLTFGTSKNLVSGPKNRTQKLFFFSPNDGVLTVYRDSKIIYQKNINSGQNFITNDLLPRGRYDATFIVSSGGKEVFREIKSIYNTGSDRLALGSYDSSVTLGMLAEEKKDDELDKFYGHGFFRSLITYRPLDSIMVGSGGTFTDNNSAFHIGFDAYLPMQSRITYVGQHFIDDGNYYDLSFSSFGWDMSYQKYDPKKAADLSRYFYGNDRFERTTIGKGFKLPYNVSGYLNYSKYNSSNLFSGESDYEVQSKILSLGLMSYIFRDISVQLNVDYDIRENDDQITTQLAIKIPLGEDFSFDSRVNYRNSDLSGVRTTLKHENMFSSNDKLDGDLTIGHNYIPYGRDENIYDASMNANLIDDKYILNSYLYADSKDNVSAVGSFSSAQIITRDGVAVTKDKANTYVIIDAQDSLHNDGWEESNKGLLVLEENGLGRSKKVLKKDKEIVPLRDYNKYKTSIDTDVVGLMNSGEKQAELFALPGSVKYIKTDLSRVISFISGFRDVFDNKVENVQCLGEACISSDVLASGVYKISVKENIGFFLGSEELVCIIPPVSKSSMLNFGYNYCVPKLEPMEQYVVKNSDESISLTFLGGYDQIDYERFIRDELESEIMSRTSLIEKVIGDLVYVYVDSENVTLNEEQKESIGHIQKLAKDINLLESNSEIILVNKY